MTWPDHSFVASGFTSRSRDSGLDPCGKSGAGPELGDFTNFHLVTGGWFLEAIHQVLNIFAIPRDEATLWSLYC